MRKAAFMPNRWLGTWRRWRAWRAGLRRDQVAVALGLLLTIGVGEPLLCVLHCQVWMPFAHRSYFSAQHQHHSTHGGMAAPELAAQPLIGQPSGCFTLWAGGDARVPTYVPPSPVRDLLLALPIACAMIVRSYAHSMRPPPGPPHLACPPPLRPPIAHAA